MCTDFTSFHHNNIIIITLEQIVASSPTQDPASASPCNPAVPFPIVEGFPLEIPLLYRH